MSALRGTMERTGDLWMWKRSDTLSGFVTSSSGVADVLALTFKTLDMQTILLRKSAKIRALTFHCPFVQRAKSAEMARRTCELVCSEHQSLFHGLVKGLPSPVLYLAPRRMGWGDTHCVKEFLISTPAQRFTGTTATPV